jgi:hypothetical protein
MEQQNKSSKAVALKKQRLLTNSGSHQLLQTSLHFHADKKYLKKNLRNQIIAFIFATT